MTSLSSSSFLSPDAFTREFARILREKRPDLTVTIAQGLVLDVDDEEGASWTAYLDNAYRDYTLSPEALGELIVARIKAQFQAPSERAAIELAQVVPVVKTRDWIEENAALLERPGQPPVEFVTDDLNAQLAVVYAVDEADTISYLTTEAFEALGVRRRELLALALDNLRMLLPEVEITHQDGVAMITAGGVYEASLLLLDELFRDGHIQVDGEIVLAVPSRDLLLAAGADEPEAVDLLRDLAKRYAEHSSYALTDTLFVYRRGQILTYRG